MLQPGMESHALVAKTRERSSATAASPAPSLLLGLDLGVAAIGVRASNARVSLQAFARRPLVRDPLVARVLVAAGAVGQEVAGLVLAPRVVGVAGRERGCRRLAVPLGHGGG